ncbi:P1 family peptidase [Limnochorda pilosa]|uniref:Peptidase S58 DmpA n=1 Tax=Limnochorda pilosa TaxID=1555112 RepID=A0A0K2SQD2_LIMPI|nr:P1 family peptidase [Limnochorda pilosa]BAS29039.1 peptidase S58 DmpA [Limnochorda pilosa]
MHPGSTNSLTDVRGLKVGHATDLDRLTGTTVILCEAGAVAGVDVRGSAPGTREVALLDPVHLVERVHAVVLSGGSAFGLDAAGGVLRVLADRGVGLPVGSGRVVPIVPAAILFDLGRGRVDRPPGPDDGEAAVRAALAPSGAGPVPQGNVGAGTGAVVGGLKGGVGSASVVLADGATVAALVAVNALGLPCDPRTGEIYARFLELNGEFGGLRPPRPDEPALPLPDPMAGPFLAGSQTTLGVVATDAALSKPQAAKLAQMAHDGLARAIRPSHTMFDGDTFFALATGQGAAVDPAALSRLGAAAADAVSRAVIHAVLRAESVGSLRRYLDRFPTARG